MKKLVLLIGIVIGLYSCGSNESRTDYIIKNNITFEYVYDSKSNQCYSVMVSKGGIGITPYIYSHTCIPCEELSKREVPVIKK